MSNVTKILLKVVVERKKIDKKMVSDEQFSFMQNNGTIFLHKKIDR